MTVTYEGRLAPKDTPADTASELREFRVDIDSTPNWEDIESAICEQIVADGIVSRWALKKHWDLSVLTQVDATRTQQLRDVLRSSRHEVPVEDDTTTVEFQLYDGRTQAWETTMLKVKSQTYEEFDDWQSSFNNRNVAAFCMDPGQIHEATIRAVAEKRPSIIGEFAPNPLLAQTLFFQTVLSNKTQVVDAFNSITL